MLVAFFGAALMTRASAGPPEADPVADAAAERARQIDALIDGTLSSDVDATRLFVIDLRDPVLAGPRGERVRDLLQRLAQPGPAAETGGDDTTDTAGAKATDKAGVPDGDSPPGHDALATAYFSFLHLAPERRTELLEAHAVRRAAAVAGDDRDAAMAARLSAVETKATHLANYLDGALDLTVDPGSLLTVDLIDDAELALSSERRQAWTTSPEGETPTKPTDAAADSAVAASLVAAELRLDTLRRQFMALSVEAQSDLATAHQQRIEQAATEVEAPPQEAPSAEELQDETDINDAEELADRTAVERELALEAAKHAKTEVKRILAEERARLLGVKEAQARYEADLTRRKTDRASNHDLAIEWTQRVDELRKSLKYESEKATEADPMYGQLRGDLAMMRGRLREELGAIRSAGAEVPEPGEGLDVSLPADIDRGDLLELRRDATAQNAELVELERTVAWDLATGLRDDVVSLNAARLQLLAMASSNLRASVTGFGGEGVDQVERELDQIKLELGYNALKFPRIGGELLSQLAQSTIAVLFGVVQFAVVVVAFVWWRRRGHGVLSQLRDNLRSNNPMTRFHVGGATVIWFLLRIRGPLEWLLVLRLGLGLFGDLEALPLLRLVWIIGAWVLGGGASILFVDALAARDTMYIAGTKDNAALRIHSLRVVGLNIIAVGLVLALTSALVGKGAIYSWVISSCWLLSFPVALHLIRKWRPIVFERLQARVDQGALSKWVLDRRTGMGSFVAAAVGAAFLLVTGFGGWIMRQLSGFEATRRLLAYLFRREVAKQAAATKADSRYHPIDRDAYLGFDPELLPAALVARVASDQIDSVVEVAADPHATLSAVIGERGSGKTVFIACVAEKLGTDRVRVLSCPEEGFEALVVKIAELTGDSSRRGEDLYVALRALGPVVIAVDDLQRLVVPAVNGLRDLDRFTRFAREVGGEVSWLVTVGTASWHYVRRARGESVFFEQVVPIPRWSEDDLGELIRGQCEAIGIAPSFEGLVVPRQASAPLPDQGDRTEAGYYRLLWDFSKGNPAVALHAFRESLFVTPDDRTVVRLFKEPSPEEIEDLSLSILFVLRTIVQLELATVTEVEAATQLPRVEVEDAMRFCASRGYVESFQGGVRLGWPWYRTITTVLQRQHLLSSL